MVISEWAKSLKCRLNLILAKTFVDFLVKVSVYNPSWLNTSVLAGSYGWSYQSNELP